MKVVHRRGTKVVGVEGDNARVLDLVDHDAAESVAGPSVLLAINSVSRTTEVLLEVAGLRDRTGNARLVLEKVEGVDLWSVYLRGWRWSLVPWEVDLARATFVWRRRRAFALRRRVFRQDICTCAFDGEGLATAVWHREAGVDGWVWSSSDCEQSRIGTGGFMEEVDRTAIFQACDFYGIETCAILGAWLCVHARVALRRAVVCVAVLVREQLEVPGVVLAWLGWIPGSGTEFPGRCALYLGVVAHHRVSLSSILAAKTRVGLGA